MAVSKTVYYKDNNFVYVDKCNRFTYDVYVSIQYGNIFSTPQQYRFASDVEIKNIVKYFKIDKYIDIECFMYSAPLRWLIDNGFAVYIKPEKKKRKYNKKKLEENGQKIEIT
jgi:hypothetical protein